MKLFVARHARTKANDKGLINGQSNDVLSERGWQELPSIVEKLHRHKFEAIYSSPLKRAMETAMPIADDHGVEIDVDRRLIEVDTGSFTGQSYKSTIPAFGMDCTDLFSSYQYDFRPYGGESSDEVKTRLEDFLQDLKKSGFGSVLVITHGGIIRWFHLLCTGEKVGIFPNLSIHAFDI